MGRGFHLSLGTRRVVGRGLHPPLGTCRGVERGLHVPSGGGENHSSKAEACLPRARHGESGQRARSPLLRWQFFRRFVITSHSVAGGDPPCPAAGSRKGPSQAEGGTGWASCRCRASWGGSPSRTWGRTGALSTDPGHRPPARGGPEPAPHGTSQPSARGPEHGGASSQAATRRRQTPRTRPCPWPACGRIAVTGHGPFPGGPRPGAAQHAHGHTYELHQARKPRVKP